MLPLHNSKLSIHQGPCGLNLRPHCTVNHTVACRQAIRRWQRSRKFVCLVAISDADPPHAAGCAVVSTASIEAFLPPPLPSGAPRRCCISNLAVSKSQRRRGIARKLLLRCETLGGSPLATSLIVREHTVVCNQLNLLTFVVTFRKEI